MKSGKNNNRIGVSLLIAIGLLIAISLSFNQRGFAKRNQPIEWGIYQILWSREYDRQLTKEIKRFSSKPDYVMFYRDLGRRFPKFAIDCIAQHHATTIVSMELWSWHGEKSDHYLLDIATGKYDIFFSTWAQAAKADGRRVLLRFGFEFNGDWFTWSGKPELFIKAWRRIHDIFQKEGAQHVEWVWSPNIVSVPRNKSNSMHLYYPGDDYVDWVGVDGYNFGDHYDLWHHWQSFGQIYESVLDDFQRRYSNKPVMISEFGCASGKPGQRQAWIHEAYTVLQKYPQVQSVIWFNYNKQRENEPNWYLQAEDGSLGAFNQTFALPRPMDE